MIKTTAGATCKAHKVQKRWGGIERDAARTSLASLIRRHFRTCGGAGLFEVIDYNNTLYLQGTALSPEDGSGAGFAALHGRPYKKESSLSYLRSLCFEGHRKPATTYSQKEPNDGIEKKEVSRSPGLRGLPDCTEKTRGALLRGPPPHCQIHRPRHHDTTEGSPDADCVWEQQTNNNSADTRTQTRKRGSSFLGRKFVPR